MKKLELKLLKWCTEITILLYVLLFAKSLELLMKRYSSLGRIIFMNKTLLKFSLKIQFFWKKKKVTKTIEIIKDIALPHVITIISYKLPWVLFIVIKQ